MSENDIPNGPGCACVSHDGYECARIRDRVHEWPDDEPEHVRRRCDCECHSMDRDELEDAP